MSSSDKETGLQNSVWTSSKSTRMSMTVWRSSDQTSLDFQVFTAGDFKDPNKSNGVEIGDTATYPDEAEMMFSPTTGSL